MTRETTPYSEFLQKTDELQKIAKPQDFPRLICLFGPSEYLNLNASRILKNKWQRWSGSTFYSLEGKELDRDRLEEIIEFENVFEPLSLYLLKGLERRQDLVESFARIGETKNPKSHVVLSFGAKALPPAYAKQMQRLKAFMVPCLDPAPFEINKFVLNAARQKNLTLDGSAVDLLKETQGHDLFKLENELEKISLIFAERKEKITAVELAPVLGVLREDHAFLVDEHLLKGEPGKTQALLAELMRRGEKPHALLGILALHCRKALKVRECLKENMPEKNIAQELRLPLPIVRSYNSYLRKADPKRFMRALAKCHFIDTKIKSSNISDEILLFDVLNELAAP